MSRSSTLMTISMLTAACSICLAPLPAQAQRERGVGPTQPDMAQAPFDGDPAELLRQRLESIDEERAQINKAIDRLDAGEAWDEVRADIQRRRGGPDAGERRQQDGLQDKMDEPRMIALLEDIDPEAAANLELLRHRNPRFAQRLLRSMEPRLGKLDRLRESNPALFEIEAEAFRIERQIMNTARTLHMAIAGLDSPDQDASIEETRDHLRDLVGQQLDAQITVQRIQLDSAKDKIESLQASIDEHVESRDAVINDRVERIMDRAIRGGANKRNRGGADGPRRRGQRSGRPDRP